jgi:hypothetical protein
VVSNTFDHWRCTRHRNHKSQVRSRRLFQDEYIDAHLIKLDLHAVNSIVFFDDSFGEIRVALFEGSHRKHDCLLCGATHHQQLVANLIQILFDESLMYHACSTV